MFHPNPDQKYLLNPVVDFHSVLWPPSEGYPDARYFPMRWTREAMVRMVSPGRLVAAWTTGGFCEPSSGNITRLAWSGDGGRTWEDAGRFEHPHRGLFTTELFVAGPDEVHAFLQVYDSWRWMSHNQMFRSISRDGGLTWSIPETVPGGVPPGWMNVGIKHSSGRWVLPLTWPEFIGEEWGEPSSGRASGIACAGWREVPTHEMPRDMESWARYGEANDWCHRNHRYAAGVVLSDDGGKTFRLRGYLTGGATGHLMEPQVVELSDGHIVMLLRSRGEGVLLRSISRDGGETWSALERTSIPNPSSKANILRHSDGRIFLLNNPSSDRSNLMSARTPLSLWVSEDDMATWSRKIDLVTKQDGCPHGLNYPSAYLDEEANAIRFLWEDSHTVFFMGIDLSRLDEPENEAFVPLETVPFSFGQGSRKAELITA